MFQFTCLELNGIGVWHDVASIVCRALGCGVTRSKRRSQQWLRKAAENGLTDA
jgi:hypothetical protein